jgi:hypothetical protein
MSNNIDDAREAEIKDFIANMRRKGFAEGDCDLADIVVRAFLKCAEIDGWRLESYLIGKDFENQINKGEN